MMKPITGDAKRATSTLYKPGNLMAPNPTAIVTAPTIPPISAWEELPGMPKYQVTRFQRIAPIKAERITPRVNTSDCAISSPIVRATVTPKRKGPRNSAIAVMLNAVRGPKARDEIMVATILLASRMPLRKSKTSARAITIMSSGDMVVFNVVARTVFVRPKQPSGSDEISLFQRGWFPRRRAHPDNDMSLGFLHNDIGNNIPRLITAV